MAYWIGKKGTDEAEAAVQPTPTATPAGTEASGVDSEDTSLEKCLKQCNVQHMNDPAQRQACKQACRDRFDDDKIKRPPDAVIACVDGKCRGTTKDKVSQDQIDACAGKTHGTPCADIIPPPNGDCPKGNYYTSTTGCEDGYVYFPGKNRCECIEWCKKIGTGASCREFGDGNDMGEFKFPPDMLEYYQMMMARGKELLGMPLGYTPEMIQKMYGRDFETIRGREGAQREAMTGLLGREGMIGTGAGRQAMSDIGWGTERNISDTLRDLFIAGEEKKKQDILDYTGMAQDLFAGGQNYWMLQEAANAARRGDMFRSLQLLLEYYGLAIQGWGT